MSRVMLINGRHAEEVRVAIVENGRLFNFQVEVADSGQTRGNIYRGVVANIEPSLDAAFVDYGVEKHGFLAGHNLIPAMQHRSDPPDGGGRPRIQDLLEVGKPLLVQVAKDAFGSKGAVLTTKFSLPGRYLVLTPYDETCAISRKVEDETVREELKQRASSLGIPKGFGYIVRTNAVGQTKATLRADLAALTRLWRRVEGEGKRGKNVRLIYDDQDLVVQALRDYLDVSVDELQLDRLDLYEKARDYIDATMPRSRVKVTHYQDRLPLFSRHNLEPQIDAMYRRSVRLKSGGSIVIDHTEALTAIDVNSGKNVGGSNQEETAYETNLEAADEVARQLRLRDVGGLIVVDFIDMRAHKHKRSLEKALRNALKADKARCRTASISSNGLLEINRQRIKHSLHLRTHRACPSCKGAGMLSSAELVTLRLLRQIEARAATGRLKHVRVTLHPELADAMQNRRRRQLADLEREFRIGIEIVAANHLHRSEEEVEWTNREASAGQHGEAEYFRTEVTNTPLGPALAEKQPSSENQRHNQQREDEPEHVDVSSESDDKLATDNASETRKSASEGSRRRRGRRGGRRRGRRPSEVTATPSNDGLHDDSEDSPTESGVGQVSDPLPDESDKDSQTTRQDQSKQVASADSSGEPEASPKPTGRRRSRGRGGRGRSRDSRSRTAAQDAPLESNSTSALSSEEGSAGADDTGVTPSSVDHEPKEVVAMDQKNDAHSADDQQDKPTTKTKRRRSYRWRSKSKPRQRSLSDSSSEAT